MSSTTAAWARYVGGRVGQAILVIWIAYTVTFVILNLMPSDPLALHLGGSSTEVSSLTPQQIAQLNAQFGLNHSLFYQYVHELINALHLNFGQSTSLSESVSTAIGQRIGTTLELAGLAIVFMLLLGIAGAYLTTLVPWRGLKAVLIRIPAFVVSVPSYLVGLLLIQLFSFSLHIFPSSGSLTFSSFVLPALTLSLPTSAVLAQVLIASLEKTLREPFIHTAQAKGLTRAQIQWRHAFRNASLPMLTVLGLLIAETVTGAVVVETVFSMSGLGRLAQQAVDSQDVPVVQAIVLLAATAFVVINLVVDLLYPLLDPRVTHVPKVV
jgi:peptide/nickel transport system permease protein